MDCCPAGLRRCATYFLCAIALLLAFPPVGRAAELPVSNFAREGLTGWETKSFKGTTVYRIVTVNGRTVIAASSSASASGLVKKISFSPVKHRYLRWSWKVAHTVTGGDERTKSGDDYAARVYVLFPGTFFWQMRAINYIWANKLAAGKSLVNAYTSNARMIAVESGNEKTGQWLTEERDLLADYRALFGADPPNAEAIAIMTDTDTTGGVAEAWYGDISLSTEGK
jgi:hypothetical protein